MAFLRKADVARADVKVGFVPHCSRSCLAVSGLLVAEGSNEPKKFDAARCTNGSVDSTRELATGTE